MNKILLLSPFILTVLLSGCQSATPNAASPNANIQTAGNQYTFVVNNPSNAVEIFSFPSSERIEYTLSKNGKVVYDSAKGRMFAQVLGNVTLAPGKSTSFPVTLPQVPAGTYMLHTWLTNSNTKEFSFTVTKKISIH